MADVSCLYIRYVVPILSLFTHGNFKLGKMGWHLASRGVVAPRLSKMKQNSRVKGGGHASPTVLIGHPWHGRLPMDSNVLVQHTTYIGAGRRMFYGCLIRFISMSQRVWKGNDTVSWQHEKMMEKGVSYSCHVCHATIFFCFENMGLIKGGIKVSLTYFFLTMPRPEVVGGFKWADGPRGFFFFLFSFSISHKVLNTTT